MVVSRMPKEENEQTQEEQPKVRYLIWGGIFSDHHELIDDFLRHGRPKKVYIFDGGDGFLRGSAELYPDSIKTKG